MTETTDQQAESISPTTAALRAAMDARNEADAATRTAFEHLQEALRLQQVRFRAMTRAYPEDREWIWLLEPQWTIGSKWVPGLSADDLKEIRNEIERIRSLGSEVQKLLEARHGERSLDLDGSS